VKGSIRLRNWLSLGLCAVGIGLLAYWAAVSIDAYLFQRQLTHRLEMTVSSDSVSSDSVSSGPEVASSTRREADTSGLVGRFEIPRLGISAMVTEGVTDQALGRGIGHVPDTAFPGEQGNVGLAAHRDTYFRRLKEVAQGDRIRLDTPDGVFSYEVEWAQVVNPDRVDLLEDTGRPTMTLVTCYPFNWVGSAPQRFVVRCRAIEEEVMAAPNPILGGAAPETGTDPMDSLQGTLTLPE
jgi:sortase A